MRPDGDTEDGRLTMESMGMRPPEPTSQYPLALRQANRFQSTTVSGLTRNQPHLVQGQPLDDEVVS